MTTEAKCVGCGRASRPGPMARHRKVCTKLITVADAAALGGVTVPADPDACWVWTRDKTRYGKLGGLRAHRAMYEVAYGVDPGDQLVCHSCDRPGCVNPRHLWLGTSADNIRDAVSKGRVTSPMLNPEVRARVAAGVPRGNNHYTRRNADIAANRVLAMLSARRQEQIR